MSGQIYQLVMRRGAQTGQIFSLLKESLSVGRDPVADIVIDDPEVSRHHAQFLFRDEQFYIQDMGSTNGTFVNGECLRGDPVLLLPDSMIAMGSNILLQFQTVPVPNDSLLTTLQANDPPSAEPIIVAEPSQEEEHHEPLVNIVDLPEDEDAEEGQATLSTPINRFFLEETPARDQVASSHAQPAEAQPHQNQRLYWLIGGLALLAVACFCVLVVLGLLYAQSQGLLGG